jgi:hypothetical protein
VSATAIADAASPAAALQRLAERQGASVIVVWVVGVRPRRARAARSGHGPGAARCACTVAVAPAGFAARDTAPELIGVAFVDRADGRTALDAACDLARAAGALVRVITVREPTDWRFTGPLDPRQSRPTSICWYAARAATARCARSCSEACPTRWFGMPRARCSWFPSPTGWPARSARASAWLAPR